MWKAIFKETCGYRGLLKAHTIDEMLNLAKFLKQFHVDDGFPDDFWNKIPDLDLCDLLPIRRAG
jgi:hypothetical protein